MLSERERHELRHGPHYWVGYLASAMREAQRITAAGWKDDEDVREEVGELLRDTLTEYDFSPFAARMRRSDQNGGS